MHSGVMLITGDMVKSARNGLGESQAAFGARFGVNQSTVARWETEGPPKGGAAGKMIERVLAEVGAVRPVVHPERARA